MTIHKVAFFLADTIMYENLWCGEIMLQSTFTSQLLNLGNCLALNPEECKIIVHRFVHEVDCLVGNASHQQD